MDNLKPNSHKSKAEPTEERKVEKIASGKVKKKSEVSKLAGVFISEDIKNVKSYVLLDVLVPAIKKAISDIVTNGIDMVLYGSNGRSKKRSSGDRISYGAYYDKGRDGDWRAAASSRPRFDVDEIVYDTRGEAEAVLSGMEEMIDHYKLVTIADMYDMSELTAPYTSNRYGWTNLTTAEVVRGRDGYIIKLPKAKPID
ncbi:MAG: hypothetical protein J6Q84_07215 [Kiritimatiellae bacterium]|nr:hypothetical protein [Kiritimatiellia bacterium]